MVLQVHTVAFSLISSRVSYCRMVSPTSKQYPLKYSKQFLALEPLNLAVEAGGPVHKAKLAMVKLPGSGFQSTSSPGSTFQRHFQIHSNNMTSQSFGEL